MCDNCGLRETLNASDIETAREQLEKKYPEQAVTTKRRGRKPSLTSKAMKSKVGRAIAKKQKVDINCLNKTTPQMQLGATFTP